jgi:EAL domain-containing protein (putative c-di-GMP-specific phosphodiesterase class I)
MSHPLALGPPTRSSALSTVSALDAAAILFVDDEEKVRTSIARLLRRAGHRVTEAASGRAALTALTAERFDVVLSDVHMPSLGGIELLRRVREFDLDVPVLLMTGAPTIETAAQAVRYGAIEYLVKPVDREVLEEAILRAARLGRLGRAKREAIGEASATHGASDRAGLEMAFASAMDTLWMAFQPVVTRDGLAFGHEALMRCKVAALPHPGAVLDAAEKLGCVSMLGRRIRAMAAAPAAADPASGDLFVNLHPQDLFDEELTAPDSPLMAIAPRVILEITERASIDSLENLRPRVAEIRAAGFRIAIDDLGAGYAGLTAFAVLEPDIVKLDMTLIRGVDSSNTKQRLVGSLASVSRDLGMRVVAEGIETPRELETVLALGCDLVQGYLLARPGPAFPAHTWPLR